MQKITLDWLKEKRACGGICNDFKKLLGDREYLTVLDIQYELKPSYIMWFAENTECAESLTILSKHKEIFVAWHVAGNVNTPIETLVELTKYKYLAVVEYAKATLKKLGV